LARHGGHGNDEAGFAPSIALSARGVFFDAGCPAASAQPTGVECDVIVGTGRARPQSRHAVAGYDPIARCRDSVQLFHETLLHILF
jgi:hypothetical protein